MRKILTILLISSLCFTACRMNEENQEDYEVETIYVFSDYPECNTIDDVFK
ncbi:MAG: hypothetical protein LBC96_00485 [Lachnospiraceae bacterium]|jgi:thioredoxin-related protein|nr:hypothetical protein [Lachnospiraceae bacterium]